jgi:UDP-galactopyranose mutase
MEASDSGCFRNNILPMTTVVVGSGPAGMAAAAAVNDPVVLLEAEAEPGGLCRSFRVGDSIFDLGGHAFFTSDREVEAMLTQDVALHTQPRKAYIWAEGATIRYPFQSHLYGLPFEVIRDCLVGLAERPPFREDPDNLREFLLASFGPGIVRHFLGPYNEKVWATSIDTIVPAWVGERIVRPSTADIIEGALRERRYENFPNAQVRYPCSDGFQALFAGLTSRTEKVRTRGRVVKVNATERIVITDDDRVFGYDWLISTMPLDDLARCLVDAPADVRDAAEGLSANSLMLISLDVRSDTPDTRQRIYCADPRVLFHKLVLNNNSAPGMSPPGRKALQLEISYSGHKPLPDGDPLEAALAALRLVGVMGAGDEVMASDIRRITRAYPVYTRSSMQAKVRIIDWCVSRRILPVGRFGEWLYVNSDGAVRRGLDAAATVNSSGEIPLRPLHRGRI